jgi:predicted 3-demethylubiquinone-9 3-methyltransferase (glyoxalase superfamily)
MQKISPCLWFDNKAEEAAEFYVSIFKSSKIKAITHYGDAGAAVSGRPKGSVMAVSFELDGQQFTALNGGPLFKFSEAISFEIACKTQKEIDYFWEKLSAGGGKKSQCGWLKDKYGVSWQVVPTGMTKLFVSKDSAKIERVMQAMLKMTKLNIQALKDAYRGSRRGG